jgi:hypothetical protein
MFRGAEKDSIAAKKWTREYMSAKFPDVALKIERPGEKRSDPWHGRFNMSRFLDKYQDGKCLQKIAHTPWEVILSLLPTKSN